MFDLSRKILQEFFQRTFLRLRTVWCFLGFTLVRIFFNDLFHYLSSQTIVRFNVLPHNVDTCWRVKNQIIAYFHFSQWFLWENKECVIYPSLFFGLFWGERQIQTQNVSVHPEENTHINRTFVRHDLLTVCVQLHTQRTLAVLLQVHAGPVRKYMFLSTLYHSPWWWRW